MRRTLLLLLTVCVGQPCLAGVSVSDDTGQPVNLTGPATRIVSLAPHLTEILFQLGVGDRIVGTSRYSDYPAAAREIPVMGDAFNVNVEAVVMARPDVVFAWQTGGASRSVARLAALGLPVYRNEAPSLEGIADTTVRMATLVGARLVGEAASAEFLDSLAALREEYGRQDGVSVFFQIGDAAIYSVNDEHLIGQAITVCGGENIMGDTRIPVPQVAIEAVVMARPDVIVVSGRGQAADNWAQRWRDLLPTGTRIRQLATDSLARPSLRMAAGITALCQAIHEEQAEVSHDI